MQKALICKDLTTSVTIRTIGKIRFSVTGVTHDLNLNIAGQTKGYDYAISGGYLNQEGIVEGSDYTRYTIKLNLNRQVKDWLKVGTSHIGFICKFKYCQDCYKQPK